ncbi:hypothetical protein [Heliorestis convoluta]|uniref:Rpn family recombination-promoting nuclease/putative transposase n=1 Tax=Heliorestis convoluta TaxID=356322 RepID=A0A5Q2MZE8_9FIRM|nr:hypothetical protein [Heliorestis convoluta]QGG48354.1 hypothetical protein FTV88_2256 [Heliorestis convoluta]
MKKQSDTAESEVSRQNKDIVLKAVAETFKEKTLEIFGLHTAPIQQIMPTVLPVVEAKEKRIDFVFLLADDTMLHLEFQTQALSDLRRIAFYGARIVERHNKPVQTVILYAGDVEESIGDLEMGSLTYNVTNLYFKGHNGDEELARIKQKIEKGEDLDDYDQLKLIFLPFMKSKKDKEERTIEAVKLAKNLNSPNSFFVIGAIIAISDTFLSQSTKKALMEVLKMTEIEQWIREEGREEGREQGRQETLREKTIAALKAGLEVTLVAQIMGLEIEEVRKLQKELD